MQPIKAPRSNAAHPPPNPVLDAAQAACKRIAPLWPLRDFIAVNPFVGLTDRTFPDACALMRRIAPGGMQMPPAFYREKHAAGEIRDADLEAALDHGRKILTGLWAKELARFD